MHINNHCERPLQHLAWHSCEEQMHLQIAYLSNHFLCCLWHPLAVAGADADANVAATVTGCACCWLPSSVTTTSASTSAAISAWRSVKLPASHTDKWQHVCCYPPQAGTLASQHPVRTPVFQFLSQSVRRLTVLSSSIGSGKLLNLSLLSTWFSVFMFCRTKGP